ncbi:hypothetical protein [Terrimonas alba]|uniref:hypothetical protein n=1 Tax=Terrimonas alba TaxID=3349636 RepID=UPI0035F4219B
MSLGIAGRILVVALWLACVSCNQSADVQIIGNWRMDSIYDNYNGFSFTNTNPYPKEVYEYRKNNTVLRKGMGEQMEYRYNLTDSTLTLTDTSGNQPSAFIILHLDKNRMALKKNRKFLFPGKNQVRYEVRYFTRIDAVELK